jgi:hypothetical protein
MFDARANNTACTASLEQFALYGHALVELIFRERPLSTDPEKSIRVFRERRHETPLTAIGITSFHICSGSLI